MRPGASAWSRRAGGTAEATRPRDGSPWQSLLHVPKPGAAPNQNRAQRTPESPIGLDGEVSKNPHQLGTVTWHPKGSETPTLVTNAAYRALYIEIKK